MLARRRLSTTGAHAILMAHGSFAPRVESEGHMNEIKRIGPPIPIVVRGAEYDLSVALNVTPSPAWRRAFHAPEEWKEPCHPSRITVKDRTLIFTSEEALVPLWIEQIDRWIAAANQKQKDVVTTAATQEVASGEDQRRKLQEVTDRLKDL
jgi:hypothetical protein